MSYQHYERLYDFSGGLNDRDANALLKNNESPDLCNVVLGKRGTFETRPGISYYRNTPVVEDKSVTSIFEYTDKDGVKHFLALAGGVLKEADGTGWAEITDGFEDGSYAEFAVNTVLGNLLFVNGDKYYEYDGTTCEEVEPYEPGEDEKTEIGDCAIPEEPKLIAFHKNRAWLANVKNYPDRVYLSVDDGVGNRLYNYFTASSFLRISNPRGEGITAIVPFKDKLYVFTKTSVRVITGDLMDEYAIINIDDNIGTVSSRTVCNLGDNLIFLANDGVYMFDGVSTPTKVSIRQAETVRRIARDYGDRACGILHQDKYYLSVPESTVNDMTMVYDTEIVPLTYVGEKHSYANTPWTVFRGFVPTQWMVGSDMNLYFASQDGYVYQYGTGFTDVGNTIDAYYTTKLIDLEIPDRIKRIRRLVLDAKQEEGSTMRIDYKVDSETNDWVMFREEVDLSEPIDRMFFYFPDGRGPLCRKIAFRFSTVYTGSRFRINGITLDMAVHGHQEERS